MTMRKKVMYTVEVTRNYPDGSTIYDNDSFITVDELMEALKEDITLYEAASSLMYTIVRHGGKR